MGRTYNGRFFSPEEPKSGTGFLIGGLAMIPLWSIPAVGIAFLAASVGCFIKCGKRGAERRMVKRFHECCTVIGLRQHVPVKELAKAVELSANDMRKQLQTMIARGYFGDGAYLDLAHSELVLPPVARETKQSGGWRELVNEVLNMLRGDQVFSDDAQDADFRPAEPVKPEPAAQPEPEPQPEPAKKPSPASVKKTYMDELERILNELYQLNEQIEDEAVSARIDRIGTLTAGIFRAVIDNPGREQDVRKFMNYYLPTTLKLLKSYDMLEEQSYQGENIVASRKKIESVLDTLIAAFEKQLDRLFQNDALDIATDIDVLETMMAGDGLSSKGQMGMH